MEDVTQDVPQGITVPPQEMREFDEFKRQKRITEARAAIRKIELEYTQAQSDRAGLRRAVKDAEKLGIGGICVPPCLVRPCRDFSGNSAVAVVACISPCGTDVTDIKVRQIKRAIKDGANIAEVTACISAVKEGSWGYVKREFKRLRRAAKKAALRINAEAPLLTSQELSKLCALACECGIGWIRTASGMYGSGADGNDVKIIKSAVKDMAAVKADGAETAAGAAALSDAGASITGSTVALRLAQEMLSIAER